MSVVETGRRALVTGVGGQDGTLLARELIAHGRMVVGTVAPGSDAARRHAAYLSGVRVVELDVTDAAGFAALLHTHRPDEVHHLAGRSSVGASWQQPELVAEVNGAAVGRLLEALRTHRDRTGDDVRFLQASSPEMFGAAAPPQDERTPLAPMNPYAEAKAVAHLACRDSRVRHGLHVSTVILYPHESPLRPERFVTRKISRAVAEMALGRREGVSLGNLDVRRDWGAARDHVRAMRLVLEQDLPADFVVATGESRPLRELVEVALAAAGVDDAAGRVRRDPALVRPDDAPDQRGDASRLRTLTGWAPTHTFAETIAAMVEADLRRLRTGVEESADYLGAPAHESP